jgi:hypothetical protein
MTQALDVSTAEPVTPERHTGEPFCVRAVGPYVRFKGITLRKVKDVEMVAGRGLDEGFSSLFSVRA